MYSEQASYIAHPQSLASGSRSDALAFFFATKKKTSSFQPPDLDSDPSPLLFTNVGSLSFTQPLRVILDCRGG